MADVSVADAPKSATVSRSVWRIIPSLLGIGGALAGIVSFFLPWYTATGGATYSGIGLIIHEYAPYDVPAYDSTFGPSPQVCSGALSGFSLPVALMGGLLVAALAISLALMWRVRRGVAFALAGTLLVASWLGALILFPLLFSLLRTDYPQGPALGPNCPPIGARGLGFDALLPCLLVIIAACLWRVALSLPSAPWLLGICAALGLLGFVAPWDLSFTPGAWYMASAAGCLITSGWNVGSCTPVNPSPVVTSAWAEQLQIVAMLPAYAAQLLILAAVLTLAIAAARTRTAGSLRALQIVSLVTGILGLMSGVLLELLIAVVSFSLGASVVALAFLLLTIFAGRAGEESRVRGLKEGVGSLIT
jgi:hypothetical protein